MAGGGVTLKKKYAAGGGDFTVSAEPCICSKGGGRTDLRLLLHQRWLSSANEPEGIGARWPDPAAKWGDGLWRNVSLSVSAQRGLLVGVGDCRPRRRRFAILGPPAGVMEQLTPPRPQSANSSRL